MVIQNKELQKKLKRYNDYQMFNIADIEDIMLEKSTSEDIPIKEEVEEAFNDNTKGYTIKHIIYVSLILSSIFAIALVIGVVFFFRYLS